MARRITIKDYFFESRLIFNRTLIAVAAMGVLIVVLLVRLTYLQVLAHEHFSTLSHDNRVKLMPMAPTRGLIYDRNGVVLAENLPSYSLELVPEQVHDIDATLERLRQVVALRDEDIAAFHELVKRKRRFESVPIRFRLDEREVAKFAVNRHRFPGVDIAARLTRHYPLGALTAHSVGYVGRIDENDLKRIDASNYAGSTHIGKVGVERSFEELLHGGVGFQHVEVNAQGRVLRVLQQQLPVPGRNVYLTLDSRLEAIAARELADFNGAVVAIDPQNGEVLALVSKPSFDPNAFVHGIGREAFQALQENEDRPLFNRALQGRYPPGSTLKPFIALAGLDYHVIGPGSTTFCPGYYMLPGDERRYRDWKRQGHGSVDLIKAIAESCDVYFYDLALTLGIDRMHAFLARFGFGQPTGIAIPGEERGLLPSREWKRRARNLPWFPGETLITGIGQGFTQVTPIQLAAATAVLAGRGQHYRPKILYATQDALSGAMTVADPVAEEPVALSDPNEWSMIVRAMVEVVHGKHGTARASGLGANYRIAGKTGTAQVFGLKEYEEYEAEKLARKLRDHALFIAFAPAEAPRIAVAVIVENGGSGSTTAAPIARKLFDAYLNGEPE